MKGNTLRKLVVYIPLGIIACCGIVLGAAFVVLQSPSLLNWLANKYGYEVEARAISLSPDLSGSISSLRIKKLHDDGLTLLASNLTAKTSLDMVLRGEVESLVLQNPRLTYRIGKETPGTSDLSFLQKLPNVRLLDIQNAEALLTLAEGQQITLTGANVTLRNFSSKTGGSVVFRTNFALTSAGETTIAASGSITGSYQLTGVYPRPYGNGTIELAVDSGTYASAGRTISLAGLKLATDALYDRQTETLAITALRGESKDLGAIQGTAKAVLRGEAPWSANLSVASIDFAQVFSIIKPFLPEEYHAWTMQGRGAVETGLQGTYADGQPAFSGNVTFSFSQGGFSSPDSTRAAQGVSGKIILKLQYAAPEQKLGFSIRSEERDGEYLWGKYYSNLAGQKASLAADGALFLGGDRQSELSGSLDFFQTGGFSFSAGGKRDDWALHVTVADVSHERLVDIFLKEYLKELSPDLAHLSVTGTSSLETVIRRYGATTTSGSPETWTKLPPLKDVMQTIVKELDASMHRAMRAGLDRKQIVIDPGLGFGKRKEQNAEILAQLELLARLEMPIMTGPSRKHFLARESQEGTEFATAAAVAACVLKGSHLVRVHDVKAMKPVVEVADEILRYQE